MEFTAIDIIKIIVLSIISSLTVNMIYDLSKESEKSIGNYILQAVMISMLVVILGIQVMHIYNIETLKNKEDSQYIQKISYSISSKEVVREKGKITYKLNFETKSSVNIKKHTIYITKEEYDLLKEGDNIPCLYNTETKSIKLDEKKFTELIKTLKDKEDTK